MTWLIALSVLTLVVQRVLGMPGLPLWTPEILLPTVWIVAPPLLHRERHWPYHALLLGLGWDLLMEPVVGPGGISWTAAALAVDALGGLVAHRSTWAWAGFGSAAVLVIVAVRSITYLPLGLATAPSLAHVVRSAVLTALWCGLVGWLIGLDLPTRWQRYRARRLH
jgi:hypothetical protein